MKHSSATPRSKQFTPNQADQQHLTGELEFQIDNLAHIAAAYSETAAVTAESVVHRFAVDIVGSFGTITRCASGKFHATVSCLPKQAIYMLLCTVTRHPVRSGDQVFHVVISVDCTDCWVGHAIRGETFQRDRRFGDVPCRDDALWGKNYRQDMAVAVRLFKTINDDHFEFDRRPVRYANGCDIILYHELIAKADDCAEVVPSNHAANPLRRLGLLRSLEEYFVQHAIDEAATISGLRLGINISLESAVLDIWWFNICEKLGSSSDIAQRLVFEVSEIEQLASSRCAIDFMTNIKRYGCQIALDNLGPESVSAWTSGAFSPDIVKIEASQVQRARASDCIHHELALLIDEAALVSGLVIVQGIRTQLDSEFVSNLGCCWQQGPHFEAPKRLNIDASAELAQPVNGKERFRQVVLRIQSLRSFARRLPWPHWTVLVTTIMWTVTIIILFLLGLQDL